MQLIPLFLAATALATTGQREGEAAKNSTDWTVMEMAEGCYLDATDLTKNGNYLGILKSPSGAYALLSRSKMLAVGKGQSVGYSISVGDTIYAAEGVASATQAKRPATILNVQSIKAVKRAAGSKGADDVRADFGDDISQAGKINVSLAGFEYETFQLNDAGAAFAELNACDQRAKQRVTLFEALPSMEQIVLGVPGYAPPDLQPPNSPASPFNNPGRWATSSDYPRTSLMEKATGITRFTLTINPSGLPSDCTVTGSSGNSDLDSATCRLLLRRARFKPATDKDGNPEQDTYSNAIRWMLPQ